MKFFERTPKDNELRALQDIGAPIGRIARIKAFTHLWNVDPGQEQPLQQNVRIIETNVPLQENSEPSESTEQS